MTGQDTPSLGFATPGTGRQSLPHGAWCEPFRCSPPGHSP